LRGVDRLGSTGSIHAEESPMKRHAMAAMAIALLVVACENEKGERPPPSYDLATAAPSPASIPQRPASPAPAVAQSERDCLAEAIYFEGRGEEREGQLAIAHVVLNRAAANGFPGHACDVIRDGEDQGQGRCQFSWRCDGKADTPTDAAAWEEAQRLAAIVLQGETTDPTQGALFFHNTKVQPDWTAKLRRTVAIGGHVYYAK
jgi:N-acetylmuramoyl-L-alanine amidase